MSTISSATRVQETTLTTGTGNYASSGIAPAGFQTVNGSGWFSNGDLVPMVITDGTDWEAGLYTFNAPTTFVRTLVWESSNAGSAIDWPSGTKRMFCTAIGSFTDMINRRHNLSATVDPAITDDNQTGYFVGSIWVNTTDASVFVCLDPSTGAAVWVRVAASNTVKMNATGGAAVAGKATLVAGTVVVDTTKVTANSIILLTPQDLSTVTAPKAVGVTARTPGTSFTITSADNTDTSDIGWAIIEPA